MTTFVPRLILLFLLSLLALPAGASGAAVGPEGSGALRVLHASPGTGPLDVWVDGERTLEGVVFGTASDYLRVDRGRHRVELKAAPSTARDAAALTASVGTSGAPRTVVARPSSAGLRQRTLRDAAAADGEPARLRVVHASPDAGAVDVQVRPTPDGEWTTVATDIAFGEGSRYVELRPGTHDVRLLATGSDDLVHVVADVAADAGSSQTVNVIGLATPGPGQPGLRTLVLPDGPGADPDAALADQTPVVDTDEDRDDPVAHRYIHGTIGDAAFQIALPDDWNGRLLTSSRGFSGTEFSNDRTYKDIALRHGYAYAASNEGWYRPTIADEPEDSYYESRRRIAELTQHASGVVIAHYGNAPERKLLAGGSNGGHHTKWLTESFPELYDGGVSMYGYNSGLEMWRAFPIFLRNYDVIEPRIGDIIAAGGGDVDPALSPEQAAALQAIYEIPAELRNGFTYDVGRAQGSEREWPEAYVSGIGYLRDSIGEWDPTYDPDGDGELSLAELKAWEPYDAPAEAQAEMRLLDLTGDLRRPIIVGQGTTDSIVSPKEATGYEALVERTRGRDAPLRTYFIPEMGHGGAAVYPFVEQALAQVEDWITYRQTGGAEGSLPGRIIGLEPATAP